MQARERVETLLEGNIPDRMGLFEHFWPETLDLWREEGQLPQETDPDTFFGYDLQKVEGSSINTEFEIGKLEVIAETDRWQVRKDGYGATLKFWKNKSGTPEHIEFEVTSREKWNEKKGALQELNPERVEENILRKDLEQARKGQRFVVYSQLVHFELLRRILGDMCMLESLLVDPEWIHDFCRTYTDFFIRHYEYIFKEIGKPDGMFIYEDLGFANGPFCSPQTYREVIFPYHKELFGYFHDHGLPVVVHTCGDTRKLIPDLIRAGMDCLQPMEAKAGNDVVELARLHGSDIAYMGNIDVTVLNSNDLDRVGEEIRHKLTSLKEMRVPYFFHSDHSLPPQVDFETYRYALQVFSRANRY